MSTALVQISPDLSTPAIPGATAERRRHRRDHTILFLLLLTLIGGVLRFTQLDKPTIWGDEAATYGRVAGTYQQMLDQLVDASFPPLHYEIDWWIGQGFPYWGRIESKAITLPDGQSLTQRDFIPTKELVPGGIRLTPFVLRFIPALCGTLFIPALYFLSRQLFGRRVSLVSATLACFSAYLLNYSRDAKMYMDFWLVMTLHVGCLLLWLRVRRPLPWLLWVVSGVTMVGLHASGFAILAVDAMIFLTTPHRSFKAWLTISQSIGWASWLPVAGVGEWRRRRNILPDEGAWQRYIVWPRLAYRRFRWPIGIFFAIGLIPIFATAYGPLGFYSQFDNRYERVTERDRSPIVNIDELGIGWVGPYNAGRTLSDYVLYTTSAYLTAWEWPRDLPMQPASDDRAHVEPRTFNLLRAAVVTLIALLAIGLVPWRKIFAPKQARLERMTQDRRVFAPFVRRRTLWIGVWLVVIPFAIYAQSTVWPSSLPDAVSSLILKNPPDVRWPRMRMPFNQSLWAFYADGSGKTELTKSAHDAWRDYSAAFTRDNIAWPACILLAVLFVLLAIAIVWRWRLLARSSMRLLLAGIVVLMLVALVSVLPRMANNSLWMPRYVALVLPTFFIAVAALIVRQPARWLRITTLTVFILVNLTQYAARLYAQSEPPSDLIAADVVRGQPQAIVKTQPAVVTFRAYTNFYPDYRSPEPGGGTLATPPTRYYLRELSGTDYPANDVRDGAYESHFNLWNFSREDLIERDLKASPQIKTFAVWTGLPAGAIDQTDPIGDRLKGQFKCVSDQTWLARDHWRWLDRWQLRRRMYVKIDRPG